MTEARKLDGSAIAAAIKEDVAREVAALAAQGIRPTTGRGAGGKCAGVGNLCTQQGAHLPGAWPGKRAADAAEDGDYGRDARAGDRAQWTRRCGRHFDTASVAATGECEAAAGGGGSGEGRRRLSSGECGAAANRTAGAGAMHAGGTDRDIEAEQSADRGTECGRHRPQRYRGQAGGDSVAGGECDGDDLSLEDPRPAGHLPHRRHRGSGNRAPRLRDSQTW